MTKAFKLLIFSVFVAVSANAQNDAISRFFNSYAEDERFTMVYISPKMFQMVAKIETNDPEWNQVRDVVKDLGGLRVLTADSIGNGLAMYKEAMSRIPVGEYDELLSVRDGKENVRIWIKDSGNVINELLLLVGQPTEFTMLSFVGNIDLDKISHLAKTLDVEGIEHLDKVHKKEEKTKIKNDEE